MATEHGIASDDNHRILPFLPQFFNQTENQACHVGALVYTASQDNLLWLFLVGRNEMFCKLFGGVENIV